MKSIGNIRTVIYLTYEIDDEEYGIHLIVNHFIIILNCIPPKGAFELTPSIGDFLTTIFFYVKKIPHPDNSFNANCTPISLFIYFL